MVIGRKPPCVSQAFVVNYGEAKAYHNNYIYRMMQQQVGLHEVMYHRHSNYASLKNILIFAMKRNIRNSVGKIVAQY